MRGMLLLKPANRGWSSCFDFSLGALQTCLYIPSMKNSLSFCVFVVFVGSAEKRAYLLQRFTQLSEESFANSRDTSFEQHVLLHTQGKGQKLVCFCPTGLCALLGFVPYCGVQLLLGKGLIYCWQCKSSSRSGSTEFEWPIAGDHYSIFLKHLPQGTMRDTITTLFRVFALFYQYLPKWTLGFLSVCVCRFVCDESISRLLTWCFIVLNAMTKLV